MDIVFDISRIDGPQKRFCELADMTRKIGGNRNGLVDAKEEVEVAIELCETENQDCRSLRSMLDIMEYPSKLIDGFRSVSRRKPGESQAELEVRMKPIFDILNILTPASREQFFLLMMNDTDPQVKLMACVARVRYSGKTEDLNICDQIIKDESNKANDAQQEEMLASFDGDIQKFLEMNIDVSNQLNRGASSDSMLDMTLGDAIRFAYKKDPQKTLVVLRSKINSSIPLVSAYLTKMINELSGNKPEAAAAQVSQPKLATVLKEMNINAPGLLDSDWKTRFLTLPSLEKAGATNEQKQRIYEALLFDENKHIRNMAALGLSSLAQTQGAALDVKILVQALTAEKVDYNKGVLVQAIFLANDKKAALMALVDFVQAEYKAVLGSFTQQELKNEYDYGSWIAMHILGPGFEGPMEQLSPALLALQLAVKLGLEKMDTAGFEDFSQGYQSGLLAAILVLKQEDPEVDLTRVNRQNLKHIEEQAEQAKQALIQKNKAAFEEIKKELR